MKSYWSIVNLDSRANGAVFRKSCPNPVSAGYCGCFLLAIQIFNFMFRTLIHLELAFIHSNRYGWSNFIFLNVGIQFCRTICLFVSLFFFCLARTDSSKLSSDPLLVYHGYTHKHTPARPGRTTGLCSTASLLSAKVFIDSLAKTTCTLRLSPLVGKKLAITVCFSEGHREGLPQEIHGRWAWAREKQETHWASSSLEPGTEEGIRH